MGARHRRRPESRIHVLDTGPLEGVPGGARLSRPQPPAVRQPAHRVAGCEVPGGRSMSNRLGIAQEMRLRTYELLKGQPASAIRKSLGLRPDECPHAALEAMRLRLERDPDPRPDVSHRQLRALKKGYNRRLINFLTRHYKSGEPLPNMPTIAKKV